MDAREDHSGTASEHHSIVLRDRNARTTRQAAHSPDLDLPSHVRRRNATSKASRIQQVLASPALKNVTTPTRHMAMSRAEGVTRLDIWNTLDPMRSLATIQANLNQAIQRARKHRHSLLIFSRGGSPENGAPPPKRSAPRSVGRSENKWVRYLVFKMMVHGRDRVLVIPKGQDSPEKLLWPAYAISA